MQPTSLLAVAITLLGLTTAAPTEDDNLVAARHDLEKRAGCDKAGLNTCIDKCKTQHAGNPEAAFLCNLYDCTVRFCL